MNGKDNLIAIVTDGSDSFSGFYLSALFSGQGPVDDQCVKKVFLSLKNAEPAMLESGKIGFFASLEEVQKFCFILGQELNCAQMNILNNDEYAHILDFSRNTQELKEALLSAGSVMKNPETSSRKGFFGRIF